MTEDEEVVCPKCCEFVMASLLCEHDDPDTGPLCIDVCCPYWHEEETAA